MNFIFATNKQEEIISYIFYRWKDIIQGTKSY